MQMCLSTANTEVTHRARWACCGPTHALPTAWEDADVGTTAAQASTRAHRGRH